MFNNEYKKETIKNLQKANKEYTVAFKNSIIQMERLYKSRNRSIQTILKLEIYLDSLANKPRGYSTTMSEIRLRYEDFQFKIDKIMKESECIEELKYKQHPLGISTTGLGVACFAPSTAMSIAMTFGTASTGTAIASLSGAAATNAALAWLGGGTLIAGGAGIAGGSLALTMAGPVGWIIGGTSIVGNVLFEIIANNNLAKKAEVATKVILIEKNRIQKVSETVNGWNKETVKVSNELNRAMLIHRRKKDYSAFSEEEKQNLASIMNVSEILSKKLGETINE